MTLEIGGRIDLAGFIKTFAQSPPFDPIAAALFSEILKAWNTLSQADQQKIETHLMQFVQITELPSQLPPPATFQRTPRRRTGFIGND